MILSTSTPARNEERFSRLEYPGSDFPFYNGVSAFISSRQWLFVMAMVVVGFLALALPIHWPAGLFWQFVPAILMAGLPLLALAHVAPVHWKTIFGRVRCREVKLMFGFALLNIVVSMAVGALIFTLVGATANGLMANLGTLDTAGRVVFFARTIPQLLGEEVITLLPFLALLQWFTKTGGMGRKGAIICAWLITSLIFGLIHLPAYGWNWIQCIVVIGTARVMLTLPWILTKNLWVSTGAHIINDWLLFSMTILGAGMVGKV